MIPALKTKSPKHLFCSSMFYKSLSKILKTAMEQRSTFPCDLCTGSFTSRRALVNHRCWHRPSAFASSSKQPTLTSTIKRGYALHENPRKSMRIDDHKFFNAAIVQEYVESEDESLQILDPNMNLGEEVDAAYILVHLAQKGKMVDGSSDSETHGKGKAVAIAAIETKEGKLESADRLDRAKALRHRYDAIALEALMRSEYKCKECNIAFPTYQALGGHKSGHSKKVASAARASDLSIVGSNGPKPTEGSSYVNIYTCLYCGQEFPTGHAFGGHKRSRACRSNYRAAVSFELSSQFPPLSPPPQALSPPPSPAQPSGFLLDLNKPPPSDNES